MNQDQRRTGVSAEESSPVKHTNNAEGNGSGELTIITKAGVDCACTGACGSRSTSQPEEPMWTAPPTGYQGYFVGTQHARRQKLWQMGVPRRAGFDKHVPTEEDRERRKILRTMKIATKQRRPYKKLLIAAKQNPEMLSMLIILLKTGRTIIV